MRLNIKESANFAKVSRPTIYTKLQNGELSKDADGLLDISDLLRVFGNSDARDKQKKQEQLNMIQREMNASLEVQLLREKIHLLESSLFDARNREEWLKGQVDKLTESAKLLEPPKAETVKEKRGFLSRLLS